MKEYFEAEMRLLRESAQEFAEAYPEQAGILNLKSLHDRDPYIERLLEGTAYLTAKIRQLIDEDIPDFYEPLLTQLAPHLLRPFPSTTIIQFNPRANQLQHTYSLPKGTIVQSKPVGTDPYKISCQFQTSSTIKINPLFIKDFTINESQSGSTCFQFVIQADGNASINKLDLQNLSVYLHADPAIALYLHYALTSNVTKVHITIPNATNIEPLILGGQEMIVPYGFTRDEVLLPNLKTQFQGAHLLMDYFSCREKYWFIKLQNLEKLNINFSCQQLRIEIHSLLALEKGFNLNKDMFKLNCVPAVNLYTKSTEPIHLSHQRTEYPIIVDPINKEVSFLYSLDKVEGITELSGKRHFYTPIHSFSQQNNQNCYYQVYHRNDIPFTTPTLAIGGNKEFQKEILSCLATVHNGHFPRSFLAENSINIPGKTIPNFITLHNVTRPTPLLLPPERKDFHSLLLAHLSLNYQSLTDVNQLRELLSLYDWSKKPENQRRILGIEKLTITMIHKVQRGVLLSGLEFYLIIREENYLSLADIHLFGWILHQFFSMYVSINMIAETRLLCQPSNKEFIWQHQHGERFPI